MKKEHIYVVIPFIILWLGSYLRDLIPGNPYDHWYHFPFIMTWISVGVGSILLSLRKIGILEKL